MDGNDLTGPPRPNPRASLSTLLLITFLVMMLSGGGEEVGQRHALENAIDRLRYRVGNYSAWLNGTDSNFTQTAPPPSLLPLTQTLIPQYEPLNTHYFSFYQNITGFLNGVVEAWNLSDPVFHSESESDSGSEAKEDRTAVLKETPPWIKIAKPFVDTLNFTAISTLPNSDLWNWTASTKGLGNLREFKPPEVASESENGNASFSFFRGNLDITTGGEDAAKLDIEGIHFLDSGRFYALAEPYGRGLDIRQLSAHVPQELQNVTAHAVERELQDRLKRYENMLQRGGPPDADAAGDDAVSPLPCSFIFVAQLEPSSISLAQMHTYEQELGDPSGARVIVPPPLILNATLISQNCGLVIRYEGTSAILVQKFWRKSIHYASFAFIVYLGLLAVTVNQMEWTLTPSSVSKVSKWVLVMQCVLDSYGFASHVAVGIISNNRASVSLIAVGFLAATLCLVFEVRYASLIQRIQAPEDAAQRPPAPRPTPTRRPPTTERPETDVESQSLIAPPAPAVPPTPPTPQVPRLLSFSDSVSSEFKAFLLALALLSVFFFLTLTQNLLAAILLVLHSLWVPQIARNVKKGTRKALRRRYILGVTLARSYFILYAYACPNNVLLAEPDDRVWLVVGWMLLQCAVLGGQEYISPTFFLPKSWEQPKGYNYLVPVPQTDAEDSAEKLHLGDCSICLEPVVSPSSGKEPGTATTLLGQDKVYSLAPCGHRFHPNCLEQWLSFKTVCPICRQSLPPM